MANATTKPTPSTAPKSQTPTAADAAKSDPTPAPAAKKSATPHPSGPVTLKRVVTDKGNIEWHPTPKTLPAANEAPIVEAGADVVPIETTAQKDTSSSKRTRFVALNKVVRTGLKKMTELSLEVARALQEIRDNELYVGTHKNFREYCRAELQLLKSQAYALAEAGAVQRDLESAMADKSKLPANERQLRPLTKLKTLEARVQAWKRTLEVVGEKPVTEADVRKVVKELQPVTKARLLPKTDRKPTGNTFGVPKTKLKAHGFENVFEQPFKWPSDVASLYSGQRKQYVKFVDTLNFSESAGALALKQHLENSLIIISADANAPEGVLFSKGAAPLIEKESFPPAFHFMAKQLNAVVEHEGTLYQAGELDDAHTTAWTPVAYADLELPDLDEDNEGGANEE